MVSYKISLEAEQDLNLIWLFGLETFSQEQADNYYFELLTQFEAIAANPLHYPCVDYIRQGYRRSVYRSHSIYFRVKADFIEIMRIYGQQDPQIL